MKEIKKLLFPLIIIIAISLVVVCLEGYKKNLLVTVFIFIGGLYVKDNVSKLYYQLRFLLGQHSWKRSQRELEISGKLQDSTLVRISFAYLFRIKVCGKYFLVPNSRTEKYQPVGGAYKFDRNEAIYLSKKFSAENDDFIRVDEVTEMDYRLLIKNEDLKAFVKRFDRTTYRENIDDLSREFKEEIFKAGILKQEDFGTLNYRYCGRHMTDIKQSPVGRFEILLADIVEVDLTDNQEELFKNLMKNASIKYQFATTKDIKSLGMDVGKQKYKDTIANHTSKLLSENSKELYKKIRYRYKYRSSISISL